MAKDQVSVEAVRDNNSASASSNASRGGRKGNSAGNGPISAGQRVREAKAHARDLLHAKVVLDRWVRLASRDAPKAGRGEELDRCDGRTKARSAQWDRPFVPDLGLVLANLDPDRASLQGFASKVPVSRARADSELGRNSEGAIANLGLAPALDPDLASKRPVSKAGTNSVPDRNSGEDLAKTPCNRGDPVVLANNLSDLTGRDAEDSSAVIKAAIKVDFVQWGPA